MCIAIVKPKGALIEEARLRTCFDHNPDGAGFAYRTDNGLVVVKGLFDINAFLRAYREHNVANTDALIHFRITTRGDESADNCHPFELSSGALVHNGTISGLGVPGVGKSDTRILSEQLHSESFDTLQRLFPVIERSVDGTRVAIMSHAGEVLVFNQRQWTEDNGATYSNSSFRESAYRYGGSWMSQQPSSLGTRYERGLSKYGTASGTHVGQLAAVDDGYEYDGYEHDGYEYDGSNECPTLSWRFDPEGDDLTPSQVYEFQNFEAVNTMEDSYLFGFFWANGQLWVENDVTEKFGRDREAEESVLDKWWDIYAAYPAPSDVKELIDFTYDTLYFSEEDEEGNTQGTSSAYEIDTIQKVA